MDQFQSPEIDKLVAAIVAAQLKLEPVKKNCKNPFFGSYYADLSTIWPALRVFAEEGIAITQSPSDSPDGHITLDTQFSHVSGQWMRSRLTMRLTKDDPQGAGSGLTYARRYALGCMSGLVTEDDDDGNIASTAKPVAPGPFKGAVHEPSVKEVLTTIPGGSSWVVPFGKQKGQPLCDLVDDDVNYLIRYYQGKLKDPANATSRFRQEWEQAVLEIRAELLARYPEGLNP